MRIISAVVAAFVLPSAAIADRVDADWRILSFTGEAAFLDASSLVGDVQKIEGGYAEGPLYSCDFAGQSMSYNVYDTASFFANPEFKIFEGVRGEIEKPDTRVFVHRISCAGEKNEDRRVLYPFITLEGGSTAWYPFESGVFSLSFE